MSAEAGYTLADMLAALVVVGLAIGGLGQGVHVISRQQAATPAAIDRSADGAAVRDALARFLSSGPDAAALTGRPRSLDLDCGPARRCGRARSGRRSTCPARGLSGSPTRPATVRTRPGRRMSGCRSTA